MKLQGIPLIIVQFILGATAIWAASETIAGNQQILPLILAIGLFVWTVIANQKRKSD